MLKKVFLQTQFGKPHEWTDQYFENVKKLEKYGWYWKIFTPNNWLSEGNVEIIPMTIEQFDELLLKKTGVCSGNHLNEFGVPSKMVSDYYPAYGHIFEDYIRDFDFWGHTNWDMVYGRLNHFLPDEMLKMVDIWSDAESTPLGAPNAINGIFALYRNSVGLNSLYRKVSGWHIMFAHHYLYGFDEVHFSQLVTKLAADGELVFEYPQHFPLHSYDRLIQHQPKPNLYMESDGALIERFEDPGGPTSGPLFPKRHYGREIMLFHFIHTKRWPL